MRDLVFLSALPFMLYAIAKRPFVALGMWIWTAMFFPNAWVYGPAAVIRYNLVFTIFTILGYFLLKDKPRVRLNSLAFLVFLFFIWTTASSIFGIGEASVTWDIWNRFLKVVLLFVFIILIVDKKLHVDFFLWCFVLSIGFYAGLEGLKFIFSGGGHKIAGFSGHILGDRNELAVSFVMMIPICFYLLDEYGKKSSLLRIGLIGTVCLLVISVVGTQSRGGFISILALGIYFFIKTDRKFLIGSLVLSVVYLLSILVSDEWISRMNTIENANEDASFMGRVVAWKLSFIMAVKHPLLGGGFKALENFPIWRMLSQEFDSFPFFYTGDAVPSTTMARAAHSVYFQVLGEHGFVGLFIYLLMLGVAFHKAGKIVAEVKKHDGEKWLAKLATMLRLSIFAFALGGAALSFAYFDGIFAIFGLIFALESRILPSSLSKERIR